MRVTVLGAGPAGLYLAYLLRRGRPDLEVKVLEQNMVDATFGFGVVFSDRALEFLKEDDEVTYNAIMPHMETWSDTLIEHKGQTVRMDGIAFASIGRLKLLTILQERARSVGIGPLYQNHIEDVEALRDADLVVAADGASSIIRRRYASEFGTKIRNLSNRFAWFGTTKPFDALTQSFVETEQGRFNAHHYRYAKDMSTFLVEVDEKTFLRNGMDRLDERASKEFCEKIFAKQLLGHPLVTNRSLWRQFPQIRNEHWSHGNIVLVGDALRTAHFSIGSGTRLAMEDATALASALLTSDFAIPAALEAYQAKRQPIVEKLIAAANASAAWYEEFASHMELEPLELAMNYITRSGRVDLSRLRLLAPKFVSTYEAGSS
jgi:2-polyprenyl-6-methoxyphenol hydroxylase-like FAD-dependent oxidoreductase